MHLFNPSSIWTPQLSPWSGSGLDSRSSEVSRWSERVSVKRGLGEQHGAGWWGLGLWPGWCWDGLPYAGCLSRQCRLREMEACRRASLTESRRGRSSRGCAEEDRIPSGGKWLVHHFFPTNMLCSWFRERLDVRNWSCFQWNIIHYVNNVSKIWFLRSLLMNSFMKVTEHKTI